MTKGDYYIAQEILLKIKDISSAELAVSLLQPLNKAIKEYEDEVFGEIMVTVGDINFEDLIAL